MVVRHWVGGDSAVSPIESRAESTVPVLVVRPSDSSPEMGKAHIRRIVVTLDGSERSEKGAADRQSDRTGDESTDSALSVLRSAEVPSHVCAVGRTAGGGGQSR